MYNHTTITATLCPSVLVLPLLVSVVVFCLGGGVHPAVSASHDGIHGGGDSKVVFIRRTVPMIIPRGAGNAGTILRDTLHEKQQVPSMLSSHRPTEPTTKEKKAATVITSSSSSLPHKLADVATNKKKTIPWNVVGNTINILSCISVLYLGYNFLQASPPKSYGNPPFSAIFLQDGFCTKNRFHPWSSSHVACFGADLILSGILVLLLKRYRQDLIVRELHNDYLTMRIPWSTIVHGLGHLCLSFLDRIPPAPPTPPQPPNMILISVSTVIYFVVFYALFAASSPTMGGSETILTRQNYRPRLTYGINILAFALAALAAFVWNQNDQLHSIRVGFTYVQILTITYAALVQLLFWSKESKTVAYAAWAAIVTFMVNMVGWWVALQCEKKIFLGLPKTLLQLWGHLWYDSYIAISYLLFLFFALKFIPPKPPAVTTQKPRWLQRFFGNKRRPA